MQISLEQFLPVEPKLAWPFIADPELMNRWSRAPIRSVALGDGGHPGGIGAMRVVTVRALGRRVHLEEVIERSEPPRRIVYRVIGGAPLRRHRGEITLEDEGRGSRLRWQVDYESPLSGIDHGMRLILDRQLRESLAKLAGVVRGKTSHPLPLASDLREASAATLWDRCEAILEEQRKLAESLERADDPKRWFTRVYAFVTEEQLALCRSGDIAHVPWVLRIIPRFHDYYVGNLRRWQGTGTGPAEAHWRSAFRAMEHGSRWFKDPLAAFSYGLAKGVQAHIEEDLPRALADVFVENYAGVCDYARFRADYLIMSDVFRRSSARLLETMPSNHFPRLARLLLPLMPQEGQDLVIHRRFYDIPRQRRRAFDRGERLAHWWLERAKEGVQAAG